jgi:hypothetical protein
MGPWETRTMAPSYGRLRLRRIWAVGSTKRPTHRKEYRPGGDGDGLGLAKSAGKGVGLIHIKAGYSSRGTLARSLGSLPLLVGGSPRRADRGPAR